MAICGSKRICICIQACGGIWGTARKAQSDILEGGVLNDATHTRYASCPHAAGPFPYMSGGMVCMSSRLTSRLASDEHFRNFNAVALTLTLTLT